LEVGVLFLGLEIAQKMQGGRGKHPREKKRGEAEN